MVLAKSSNLASLSRSQLSANSRRTAITFYTRNKTILKAVPNLQKVGNKDHNNKDPVLIWVVKMSILLAHEESGRHGPSSRLVAQSYHLVKRQICIQTPGVERYV